MFESWRHRKDSFEVFVPSHNLSPSLQRFRLGLVRNPPFQVLFTLFVSLGVACFDDLE